MELQDRPKEPLPEVDWKTFLEDFPEGLHGALHAKILEPGIEGLVMAGTPELTSGDQKIAAVVFGPNCTFKFSDLHVGRIFGETPGSWRAMRHLVRCSAVTLRHDSSNPPLSNTPRQDDGPTHPRRSMRNR